MFLFIASKVFIVFSAYQSLASLKDYYKDDFLLTYDWVSSSWNGSVSIEGIELTPYSMKKTFNIERITLFYADYFSLVSQLPSLKSGDIAQLKNISIPHIQTELKGKSFHELFVEAWGPAWFAPFDVYGCGSLHNLKPEDYQSMGLSQWNASLEINIEKNKQGEDLLGLIFDQKELGKINFVSEWPAHSIEKIFKLQDLTELSVLRLDIEHQDAGLFRRLNVLCNKSDVKQRHLFSANAALDWKNAMFAQGLLLNDNLLELYNNYLLQGGALSVTARKDGGFKLGNVKNLINKELINYFQVSFNLNGQAFNSSELYVDGSILYPPIKEVKVEALPTVNNVTFEPGYKLIDLESVDQHIGRKIKVQMINGKEYEGLLGVVTEYNLELSQILPGGVVNYPLMLNEINTLEVWINQQQ